MLGLFYFIDLLPLNNSPALKGLSLQLYDDRHAIASIYNDNCMEEPDVKKNVKYFCRILYNFLDRNDLLCYFSVTIPIDY